MNHVFNHALPALIMKTQPLYSIIDDETINIIREIQKPLFCYDDYFQYVRAVSVVPDHNKSYRTTYLTFEKNDKEQWVFIGLCFSLGRKSQYDKKGNFIR